MTIQHIHIPDDALSALCSKWQISKLAIFGSALGDNFSEESDVDFLVDFEEQAEISLFDQQRYALIVTWRQLRQLIQIPDLRWVQRSL